MPQRAQAEPRGCPTPGSCSAVERIAELEQQLQEAMEAMKHIIKSRDAEVAQLKRRVAKLDSQLEAALAIIGEERGGGREHALEIIRAALDEAELPSMRESK